MIPYGTLVAAAEEIVRKAALLRAEPADLYALAGRLDHAAARVRVLAACREAEATPRMPPRTLSRRAAA